MSSTPLRHLFCLGLAGLLVGLLAVPGVTLAKTPGNYLSWQNKAPPPAATTDTQPATVTSGGQSYPVPPSPYGQVGDPFARNLSWPSKQGAATPAQPAALANVQRPQPAPIAVPAPPLTLEPQHPNVSVSAPVPLATPTPVRVPKEAVAAATQPAPRLAPSVKPVPAPAPAATPASPVQAAADAGYQVPATSKYAAQIASARAHQAAEQAKAQAANTAPTATATPKTAKSSIATVPAPTAQMASEETDHVFIPGEQYKNAGDAPRLYSLHRAYGLTPDPITVDHNATGAILGSADLHADEGEDDTLPAPSSESASKAKP